MTLADLLDAVLLTAAVAVLLASVFILRGDVRWLLQ